MKPGIKLKINNIKELNEHVERAQVLLEELRKEMDIVSNFNLQIESEEMDAHR